MAFDKIILALYLTNFFINAAISLLAPFYPKIAQEKVRIIIENILKTMTIIIIFH
jgi:hypothetical protein